MNLISRTLADVATRLFFETAEISAVVEHSDRFKSIELSGSDLQGVAWHVGDKIQVRADKDGFTLRTYTPVMWDPAAGVTRLLVHMHGEGPGSTWAHTATVGDKCEFTGPRRSLRLDESTTPLVLVGDETSFALAAAWHNSYPDASPTAALFEVSDAVEAQSVLDSIGLGTATVIPRTGRDDHLEEFGSVLTKVLADNHDDVLCLTGKAQTISHLRRSIKRAGVGERTTLVKAYWDKNRSGLD